MSTSHVLVVEDDPDMSEVVMLALQHAGYAAQTAPNGREALEAVSRRMPTLILLDMMMPVMDGWQFAREFRTRYGSAVPIVVVTAAEHSEKRALEVGASDWLPKPFDLGVLLSTVARLTQSLPGTSVSPGPGLEKTPGSR